MHLFLTALPIAALSACSAATPQAIAPAIAAPFTVPMDPGTIACSAVSNPVALTAATDWALGKARAAALAGVLTAVPDQASVSMNLANFCATNPGETVRTAARQFGIS